MLRKQILILLVFAALSSCDRRPVPKDLQRSEGNSVDHSKMRHSAMESSPNAASAPYELQFLDTMIAHHQGAIDMAQLVQTRAGHVELKDLARKIVSDQQKEISQMRQLRDKFFAGAPPAVNMDMPGMRDGMQGMDLEKLDALKENTFDVEFIRQMIPHHEGAVEMARDALSKLAAGAESNPELTDFVRRFSQSIIDAQTSEIRRMHEWQAAWTK